MNLRLIAASIIDQVTDGISLSDALKQQLPLIVAPRDRAFVQALCYGVCRFYPRLDVILNTLLTRPMKAKDSLVHALLMVGLYQLVDMRVPEHAAVAETVEAAAGLKKPWARGFINANLRNFLRKRATIMAQCEKDLEGKFAHDYWWIKAIKKAWPEQFAEILAANNVHPPMSLRCNQQKISREHYLQLLQEASIVADIIPETAHGILLQEAKPVEDLPKFGEGFISVQDGAAQLAAELLQAKSGERVLDACAAPGGKLTHLLECMPDITVVAVEKEAERMLIIEENLARLSQKAICHVADVGEIDTWWDGQLFDRILLDAPCSASGVIRRHPDIKLLREERDIAALAKIQRELLQALWQTLAVGGTLLYATCSIFPLENTEVVRDFLAANNDAREEKIIATWGVTSEFGRQILTGMANMDGFYYAKLYKERS